MDENGPAAAGAPGNGAVGGVNPGRPGIETVENGDYSDCSGPDFIALMRSFLSRQRRTLLPPFLWLDRFICISPRRWKTVKSDSANNNGLGIGGA